MCRLLVNLALAYLLDTCFVRQIIRGILLINPLLSSAADSHLRKYTRDANIDSRETPHILRSGCALTLAFFGFPLADVMSHVGWSDSKTALYYLVSWRFQGWPTCFCSFAVSGGLSHLRRLQFLKGFCFKQIFCSSRKDFSYRKCSIALFIVASMSARFDNRCLSPSISHSSSMSPVLEW